MVEKFVGLEMKNTALLVTLENESALCLQIFKKSIWVDEVAQRHAEHQQQQNSRQSGSPRDPLGEYSKDWDSSQIVKELLFQRCILQWVIDCYFIHVWSVANTGLYEIGGHQTVVEFLTGIYRG